MNKVAFTNQADHAVHIGPVRVDAGATREVDPTHLSHQPESDAEPVPESPPVTALLDGKVPDIVAAISARNESGSPVISDDDLVVLAHAEEEGKTRSSLMDAFSNEQLARAAQKADEN